MGKTHGVEKNQGAKEPQRGSTKRHGFYEIKPL